MSNAYRRALIQSSLCHYHNSCINRICRVPLPIQTESFPLDQQYITAEAAFNENTKLLRMSLAKNGLNNIQVTTNERFSAIVYIAPVRP